MNAATSDHTDASTWGTAHLSGHSFGAPIEGLMWDTQAVKTLAEQKAAVLAAAALKKAQRRDARQKEEAENLERMRLARQAEDALDESALATQVGLVITTASKRQWKLRDETEA